MRSRAGNRSSAFRAIVLTGVLLSGFGLDSAALSLEPPQKEVTVYDVIRSADMDSLQRNARKLPPEERLWRNDVYQVDGWSRQLSGSSAPPEGRAGRVTYGLQYNFSLVVSFQWDAPYAAFADMDGGIRGASDVLGDVTDGQMRFDRVDIYRNGVNWDTADIQILNDSALRPYTTTTYQPFSGNIHLGSTIYGQPWNSAFGSYMITHEFGHHALALPDEYDDVAGQGSVPREYDVCMMADTTTELCTESNHDSTKPGQWQNSCWKVAKGWYPRLTEVTGTPDSGPASGLPPVVAWHFPDLSVDPANIIFVPDSGVQAGTNVTVRVGITNSEGLAAGTYDVKFFDGDAPDPFAVTAVTLTGQLSLVQAAWKATGGVHDIIVRVDTANRLAEKNEGNNAATRRITVNYQPTVDAGLGTIRGSEDAPLSFNFTRYGKDVEDAAAGLRWAVTGVDTRNISRYEAAGVNTFVFYPRADWYGAADIVLLLNDTMGGETSRTVTLNFTPVNDLPQVTAMGVNLSQVFRLGAAGVWLGGADKEDPVSGLVPEVEFLPPGAAGWKGLNAAWNADRERFEATFVPASSAGVGPGDFRARLTDGDGGTGVWRYLNGSLAVLNNPPSIRDFSLSLPSVSRGGAVTLTAIAVDAENPPGELALLPEYRYPGGAWREIPGLNYNDVTGAWTGDFSPPLTEPAGLYDFRLTLVDANGDADEAYLNESLEVKNGNPGVTAVKPGKRSASRLERVEITVVAADNETMPRDLSVEFTVVPGGAGYLVSAAEWSGTEKAWKAGFTPRADTYPGRYIVRARVRDSDGAFSNWADSPELTLVNLPPEARITFTGDARSGKALVFSAAGSVDPEGDELLFYWNFGDGTVGTGPTATHAFGDAEDYVVTLSVKDRYGAVTNRSLPVRIAPAVADGPGATPPAGGTTGVYLFGLGGLLAAGLLTGAFIAVRRGRRAGAGGRAGRAERRTRKNDTEE